MAQLLPAAVEHDDLLCLSAALVLDRFRVALGFEKPPLLVECRSIAVLDVRRIEGAFASKVLDARSSSTGSQESVEAPL